MAENSSSSSSSSIKESKYSAQRLIPDTNDTEQGTNYKTLEEQVNKKNPENKKSLKNKRKIKRKIAQGKGEILYPITAQVYKIEEIKQDLETSSPLFPEAPQHRPLRIDYR